MSRSATTLTGRVAVVTGGARGVGAAVARALAGAGVRVAIADLDAAPGTFARRVDVTDRPAFTGFLDDVECRLGAIDILVNNAGIMPIGPIEREADVSTERQLAINLHAVIHGTREAVRRMRPRGHGHIVNVASATAKGGLPHLATYGATKYGVLGFSDAIRRELRGTGIEISVVLPGLVRTRLSAGTRPMLLIRPSTPDDVASAIVDSLRTPRFEVYVPRRLGVAIALSAVLPRSARDALFHWSGADAVVARADAVARAPYEAELARAATGAEVTPAGHQGGG